MPIDSQGTHLPPRLRREFGIIYWVLTCGICCLGPACFLVSLENEDLRAVIELKAFVHAVGGAVLTRLAPGLAAHGFLDLAHLKVSKSLQRQLARGYSYILLSTLHLFLWTPRQLEQVTQEHQMNERVGGQSERRRSEHSRWQVMSGLLLQIYQPWLKICILIWTTNFELVRSALGLVEGTGLGCNRLFWALLRQAG